MASTFYIVLSALLIIWLSMHVIKLRRQHQVSVGNDNKQDLVLAIAAQSNATEFLPIGMLLLVVLELNHAEILLVHLPGISLLSGRILHARAMLTDNLKLRVLSMKITIYTLLLLVAANLIYLLFGKQG